MMDLVRQVYGIFSRRQRWQLVILAGALIVRAGVEVIGVASIAPFMSLVANPSAVETNEWLSRAYDGLGFESTASFLTATGVAVVVVLTLSNAFSAAALWGMLRFSWSAHHQLSIRLMEGYLRQPYSFFVQRNSASMNKTILSEVASVTTGVLVPVLNVIARSLVILALIALLVVMEPLLAAVVVLVLGGIYGGVYLAVRRKQQRLGVARIEANQERYRIAGETFGGIKDVLVLQREDSFLGRFAGPSRTFSESTASNAVLSQIPRYLLETIAFGGIVLIVLFYLRTGEGIEQILPMLSLYVFAGYRLMPELQQLFAGMSQLRFNRAALDDVVDSLDFSRGGASRSVGPPLPFGSSIRLDRVTFQYEGSDSPAVDDVSLTIHANETVGLVGESGSGKTTLVDLLLGLYTPDEGRILVDDVPLEQHRLARWRPRIGYVPQSIFLCDDSIIANIAFGIDPKNIDQERVRRAARMAHLHEFVRSLPDEYLTVVGERGVRLSGGQRQRIGIARALYHDPPVLVMDEATSALDGATEDAVMEAIRALGGKKTIILIAHRLSTVRHADRIVLLDGGRIMDVGAPSALIERNALFRKLARREQMAQ